MKYWSEKGGLPIFGYPISTAHNEHNLSDGKDYLVQYFERNRFEYHPEFAGTDNEVLLGLLGVQLSQTKSFPTVAPFGNAADKIYIDATQHSLS